MENFLYVALLKIKTISSDPTLCIAMTSLFISFVSAIFAFYSILIAKRSLLLSEEQAKARHPQLVSYLIDGFIRRLDKRNAQLYAFSLSLSNRSDNDNSLSFVELRVIFTRANSLSSNILFQHNPTLSKHFGLDGVEPFIIPAHIKAHGRDIVKCCG